MSGVQQPFLLKLSAGALEALGIRTVECVQMHAVGKLGQRAHLAALQLLDKFVHIVAAGKLQFACQQPIHGVLDRNGQHLAAVVDHDIELLFGVLNTVGAGDGIHAAAAIGEDIAPRRAGNFLAGGTQQRNVADDYLPAHAVGGGEAAGADGLGRDCEPAHDIFSSVNGVHLFRSLSSALLEHFVLERHELGGQVNIVLMREVEALDLRPQRAHAVGAGALYLLERRQLVDKLAVFKYRHLELNRAEAVHDLGLPACLGVADLKGPGVVNDLVVQGDVVGLTDASGTFVAQYTYNAWGEVLTATGSIAGINPLRYRGYYYDSETGFYYLQSRYYDPANHRFINADSYASTGQGCIGTNMFAYCLNNPVTATDPTGYDSTTDSNGNGIADYLEIRWFVQTEKAKIQLASKNGALRDVTEEVDKALKYACFIGDAYRALIESGGPIFRAEMSVYALKKFYTMVNHEAEWDIKRKAQWESTIGTTFPGYDTVVLYHNQAMTPEMIGNYTYGVIGEAFGFSIDTLLAGSFVAAGFPTEGAELINEYTDWNYIRRGYYHISLDGAY